MFLVNDIKITPTIFPDKTSQIWNLPEELLMYPDFHVRWEFEHEGEISHLSQLAQLLDKIVDDRGGLISLYIKYLPYGRQDKEVSNKTTFALHSFAKMINGMAFNYIEICDPHSKEALNLIDRSSACYPTQIVEKVTVETKSNIFCYPDKGAVEKYTKIYGAMFIYGEKVRDQASGRITSYQLVGNPIGKRVLIVDDICDGGATFVLLAKELLQAGATEVNLFVTHGIFSKGLKPLYESGIKRVFTQDGEADEHYVDGHSGRTEITYRRL
jgi:ribose-phosphate pyrophosphokinase